jgi:Domain of unknown function (DUF4412)
MKRIALYALGTCAAGLANAGVYVEMVDQDLATSQSELTQKMYVQGGLGRFVDDEGRATLIKNDTLYIIDDADRSYVVFDKAAMEQLAKKLNAGIERMKEQMAKLPADQRSQMEKALAGQIPGMGGELEKATIEVIDTGKTDKVDGRACRLWDLKRNGELDEQLCVTPYSALPGNENLQQIFANFAKVFEEMAKSVPMLAGDMDREFEAQAKVNGFPVRTRPYDNGKLGDRVQLMKVWREEKIPASMFDVPAGYKQKQMQLGE